MKGETSMALVAMGVGGTLLYQQVMNGNAKRMLRDMQKNIRRTIV